MPYLLNLVYLLVLIFASPWLVYKALTTGKYCRSLWTKLTGRVPFRSLRADTIVVWFHGVSVGEIHLLRQVIAAYRKRFPHHHCVISTTTDTGYDEACKHFVDLPVFFWPFDFTWAVKTALGR
ncbi:MAG: 3-deoxy-D-manno-octulosonic acid transferase, partial [Gemmataceae bacterium]|nr:3-deoxy-D-manno-octulosonic acid transferase [Gemmataceae bacterium]